MAAIVPGILAGAMATSTVEDYLKCIFHEQERAPGTLVATGQIASALEVAPASVTAMVKTLADSGLLATSPTPASPSPRPGSSWPPTCCGATG
jgi:hypothetical protein